MILHLDLDCFFAAAHRIDNPQLEDIPIAVGGRSNLSIFNNDSEKRELSKISGAFTSSILSFGENSKTFHQYFVDVDKNGYEKIRGIITTSSYEARAYGVKTAMSVAEALRWCPSLIVLPPNYPLYHKLSHQLKILLEKKIPSIEQFSIDEFFGDLTGWVEDNDVEDFAYKLKQEIYDELKLPISIGIAKSKWIAKLATNDSKPNGIKLVKDSQIESYIKHKNIMEFCGIGKGYQKRLLSHGITTLGEVKNKKELFDSWGKFGTTLYNRILGIDNEKLSLNTKSSKSIGLGRTFDPLHDREEIKRRITILCRHLSFLANKGNHNPITYSLDIKYQYGDKVHNTINTKRDFNEQLFKDEVLKLFKKIDIHPKHSLVQINITLSNFIEDKLVTKNLFTLDDDIKQKKLTKSIHKLRDRFGIDIIKSGSEL